MAPPGSRSPRILVVEDDLDVRKLVAHALGRSGYSTIEAATLEGARRLLQEEDDVDLAIVDLILPDGDGLDLVADLHRERRMPVIALSARRDDGDTVLGLELGADDYIAKPFSPRVLTARVGAVLRRDVRPPNEPEPLVYGHVEIDPARRAVLMRGREVPFTRMEFDLLWALASRSRRACSRAELLRWVWKSPVVVHTSTVTEHVRRVRQKIEAGDDHEWIVTLRGVGYRFDPPPATQPLARANRS